MAFEFKIDFSELTEFQKDMTRLAHDYKNGRFIKQFLRQTGNKARTRVKRAGKGSIKREYTGNLLKGIKRGKVYFHKPSDSFAVRVYGGSPAYHTNLLNYGHEHYFMGNYIGYFQGYNYFEKGLKEYEPIFYQDLDKMIDKMLRDYLL